jgi:hypothetical protein
MSPPFDLRKAGKGAVEKQTVYLDEGDPRKSRWFWIFQCLVLVSAVFHGVTGLADPDHRILSVLLLVAAGIAMGGTAYFRLLSRDPERRPHVSFSANDLVVKQTLYSRPLTFSRGDIELVELKPAAFVVSLKDSGRKSIRLELTSYATVQQMRPHVDAFNKSGGGPDGQMKQEA